MKDGDDHEAGARQGEGAALDPQKGGALLKPFPGGVAAGEGQGRYSNKNIVTR